MRLMLYYGICNVISAAPILVIQIPLPAVLQEYIYCNWKYIAEWSFFEIKSFSIYAEKKFQP